MTVKVTKDALNLREKLSELDKPSGIAGQDILKADTPQEVFNYIGAGRRNLIINGAMQVAQRGTNSTPTSGQYAIVDRFSIRNQNGYMADVSPNWDKVTDAPDGFEYSQKVTIGTGTTPESSDNFWLDYKAEGNDCSHLNFGKSSAKTITLSFWVKSSVTGNYDIALLNDSYNRHYVTQYTINTANTWEYKTITVAGDTSGAWSTGTAVGIAIHFVLTISSASGNATSTLDTWATGDKRGSTTCTALGATTGATWQLTGVQLEVGSVATPFEHRSYGEELALCQRYYYQTPNSTSSNQKIYWEGYSASGSYAHLDIFFPTQMRTTPACTISAVFSISGMSADPTVHTVFPNKVRIQSAVTGGAGRKYYSQDSGTGLIADAEL